MKIHKSVTLQRVTRLAKAQMFGTSNRGICTHCGKTQDGCEPDAREYTCHSCKQPTVYGAPELLVTGHFADHAI